MAALGLGEVFGDAGPDKGAGGVVHAAADFQALGTALAHHLLEEEGVQLWRGVCDLETRVSIAGGIDFRDHGFRFQYGPSKRSPL